MHKSHSTKAATRSKSHAPKDDSDSISNSVKSEIPHPENSFGKGGENVRVGIRIRPMNELELQRGDINCLRLEGERTLQINHKY